RQRASRVRRPPTPERLTTMPSIADAAAKTLSAGLPVLFLDTCSLLDVIRAPQRLLRGCVESAVELQRLLTPPVGCTLVVGSFVSGEWHTHAGTTAEELRRHLARMDEQAGYFHDSCGSLGIAVPFSRPVYGGLGLADKLQDLSRQLLDSAIPLDPHNDTMLRG